MNKYRFVTSIVLIFLSARTNTPFQTREGEEFSCLRRLTRTSDLSFSLKYIAAQQLYCLCVSSSPLSILAWILLFKYQSSLRFLSSVVPVQVSVPASCCTLVSLALSLDPISPASCICDVLVYVREASSADDAVFTESKVSPCSESPSLRQQSYSASPPPRSGSARESPTHVMYISMHKRAKRGKERKRERDVVLRATQRRRCIGGRDHCVSRRFSRGTNARSTIPRTPAPSLQSIYNAQSLVSVRGLSRNTRVRVCERHDAYAGLTLQFVSGALACGDLLFVCDLLMEKISSSSWQQKLVKYESHHFSSPVRFLLLCAASPVCR